MMEGGVPRKRFQFGGMDSGGYDPGVESGYDAGMGGFGDSGAVDTGDLGSEAANVAANLSATSFGGGGSDDLNPAEKFRVASLKNQIDQMYGQASKFPSFLSAFSIGRPKFAPEFYTDVDLDYDDLGLSGKDATRAQRIREAINKAQTTGILTQAEFEKAFGNMNINTPSGPDDGPSTPIIPIAPTMIAKDDSDDDEVENEFVQRFTLPERFRLAEGGDMRQEYGLGSLVKKITGTVKKVAKSPIGKAALAIGLGAYGLGAGPFASGKLASIPGAGFLKSPGFLKFMFKGGKPGFKNLTNTGVFSAIAGASALAGALTPKEEEQESLSQKIADRTGIDVTAIRKEVQDAYASGNTASLRTKYPFLIPETAAADGGRVGMAVGGIMRLKKLLDEAYEMVSSRGDFDFSDYKMRGQLMAEELSELKFGKDYYDLDQKTQMNLYKQSSDYLDNVADDAADNLFDRMKEGRKGGGRIGFNNGGTYKDFEEFMKKRGKFQKERNLKQLQEEFKRYINRNKPVEAAEGGMMDMGGMEMDLRGGGFVPIGAKEKADDVPARLSKNEFVFTADAVRAAGGGSVDRGADLMYKTMKQLENKVV